MTEEVRLALVEENMKDIKAEISDIKTELKTMGKQIDTMLTTKISDHVQMQSQINQLSEKMKSYDNQSNLWKWLAPTLSAILSSVVTFLIISYLQKT